MSLINGELGQLTTTRLTGQNEPGYAMPLALSVDKQRLYAVSRGVPFFISAFDVSAGELHFSGRAEIENNLACLRITPDGNYLLGASYNDDCIGVYPLEKNGQIGAEHQIYKTDKNAHMFALSPEESGLFSTSLGGDCLYFWAEERLSLSNKLDVQKAEVLRFPNGSGPRHFSFHPELPLLYVISEYSGEITTIQYQQAGLTVMDVVQLPNVGERAHAADIHITPNGRYLYATDRVNSELFSYRVCDAGRLAFVEVQQSLDYPRSFVISEDSHWLVVAGEHSKTIASYQIDSATGRLQKAHTLNIGHAVDWIEC